MTREDDMAGVQMEAAGLSNESAPAAEDLADSIARLTEPAATVDVQISFAILRLLSEQLYASPVKAIEELVVNGWDADATTCSVLVEGGSGERNLIAVFDNGTGMNIEQLTQLWHVGVSRKADATRERKYIGKFGIGKLASYAVARRVTYITRSAGQDILAVTVNFDDLSPRSDDPSANSEPLSLPIHALTHEQLAAFPAFSRAVAVLDWEEVVGSPRVSLETEDSWTLVVLEDLRERASALATGRLSWVLETAMPYASDFALHLNGESLQSRKRDYERVVQFGVHEIEPKRLKDLNDQGEDWAVAGDRLISTRFPSGVSGEVTVTHKSLYSQGGKSEDLGRSHGFFVRVHKRLVNETDPLFGARPLSFATWYNFAAEIEADDLNPYITASRDDLEQSELKPALRELLVALFNQARERKEGQDDERMRAEREKTEGEREYVSRTIVERPLADALVATASNSEDAEAWSLVDPIEDEAALEHMVSVLYDGEAPRRRYSYRYSNLGSNEPFARLDPAASVLTLNEAHGLVQEFGSSTPTRRLLELFATAEAMLEAYMHEARIPFETVRELLARRDLLLRSLAEDESQSLVALASAVRESALASEDSKGFEIAVVGALRALGFATQHVSGSGTPDGLAHYQVYGTAGRRLTLETKASGATPSLNNIDMAGLSSHAKDADGVLLVAPTYPGIDDETSEITTRARQQRISCWTAEQLASVVENAERRHITAQSVEALILEHFAPVDVRTAIDRLIGEPTYSRVEIYVAILDTLDRLKDRLVAAPRTVDMVAGIIATNDPALGNVLKEEISEAVETLARHSKGLLHVTGEGEIALLGDLEEIRRRTESLTDSDSQPRRRGTFRSR